MVVATAVLAGLSFLIIILESSHLRSHAEDVADIHESHPILKEKLKEKSNCDVAKLRQIRLYFKTVENNVSKIEDWPSLPAH